MDRGPGLRGILTEQHPIGTRKVRQAELGTAIAADAQLGQPDGQSAGTRRLAGADMAAARLIDQEVGESFFSREINAWLSRAQHPANQLSVATGNCITATDTDEKKFQI